MWINDIFAKEFYVADEEQIKYLFPASFSLSFITEIIRAQYKEALSSPWKKLQETPQTNHLPLPFRDCSFLSSPSLCEG